MKPCTICKVDKPLNEFNKHRGKKDGLQNVCKKCNRERSKQYYQNNIEKHRKVVYDRKRQQVQRNREYVWDWLSLHPCIDCNEEDIVVLEFDHRRDKEINVSKAVAEGWSIPRIQREIDKCEVRCANCHRRRTALEFEWKILKYRGQDDVCEQFGTGSESRREAEEETAAPDH